jgi:hypothetical protein
VENKIAIGLVKDFPEKSRAWAEVERLHLDINQVDSRRGVTFADLLLLGVARSNSGSILLNSELLTQKWRQLLRGPWCAG